MGQKVTYSILILTFLSFCGMGQDVASGNTHNSLYQEAYEEVDRGRFEVANAKLGQMVKEHPSHRDASILLARSYSWAGRYDRAREVFNTLTSQEKNNRDIWISSIKNELYANNSATALGLANKASMHVQNDMEIERLRTISMERVKAQSYAESGWSDQEGKKGITIENPKKGVRKIPQDTEEPIANMMVTDSIDAKGPETVVPKTPVDKEIQSNRLSFRNALTVFDQRYDPIIASSISYKRQTLAGSLIPRINYNNRRGLHGVQYDLDFYPKFSKRFYAYLNYGYSKASIFPNHKMGGDLYANLPGAMEFSAGGRHIIFATRNVSVVTNSIGHYRGNYYFSLRSYVTPLPDNLTRVSGNLLVRKYGRDAENYMGMNVGMGYSPEVRQLTAGDELLAETLLYVESQRLSLEYQFTGKKSPNIYRANVGVARQELAFDSGNYFWSINAGFTYQVQF